MVFRFAAGVARHPARIDVGGVDEIHAGVDPGIEQAEGQRLVDGPAEHVAAEAERRDLEIRAAEARAARRDSSRNCGRIGAGLQAALVLCRRVRTAA
jgi:hypothetical protein